MDNTVNLFISIVIILMTIHMVMLTSQDLRKLDRENKTVETIHNAWYLDYIKIKGIYNVL